MANQIYSLIHMFRRLMSTANDALDGVVSPDDENEPGQHLGDGDISLTQLSLDDPRQRSRTNLWVMDVEFFRQHLNDTSTVLVDIYNSNGLCLCELRVMEAKILGHMTRTGAYSFIEELSDDNLTCVREQLDSIVEHVTTSLNDLLARQCITQSQFYQMTIERSMVRMDYGYFLPDTSKVSDPSLCCV